MQSNSHGHNSFALGFNNSIGLESVQLVPGTIVDHSNIFTEIVFNYIKINDYSQLQTLLLKEGRGINLLDMRDVKFFSVLSFAAYKNSEECLIQLYNHALENNTKDDPNLSVQDKKKALQGWVNY